MPGIPAATKLSVRAQHGSSRSCSGRHSAELAWFHDPWALCAGTALGNGMIHFAILVPVFILVVWFIPVTTRSISLAIGVLHLHEDAVSKVERHMEKIWSMRKRIWNRMSKSKIIKGKRQPAKGQELLQQCLQSAVLCLHQITPRAAGGARSSRMGRGEFEAQFSPKDRSIAKKLGLDELAEFMSRDSFEEYQEASLYEKQVWQGAKTLELGEKPEDDTMEMWEYEEFLVRTIAHVLNLAEEHGAPAASIKDFVQQFKAQCPSLAEDRFQQARMLARIKSLFSAVNKGKSGMGRTQLHKALRKYRCATHDDAPALCARG